MLPVICHHDSRLCSIAAGLYTDVASDPDQLIPLRVKGDDRFVVRVVYVGQVLQRPVAQLVQRGEEAPVARLLAEPVKRGDYAPAVA